MRPYQVLCAVCSLGEDDPGTVDPAIREILEIIQRAPDTAITLRCNAGEVFGYQAPGTADDTPDGAEYNVRRDLEILYKLNLSPGCTLPARIVFNRLLETIKNVSGVCVYGPATSEAWKGCPKAGSGHYKKGREKGINAIIPPRTQREMKKEKAASLKAMYKAKAIRTRPHILMCSLCQYGGGVKPPYAEDNLPELVELMLKEPDTLITLVPYADWMMCASCPTRAPQLNACVNNKGSGGLPNQLRDLRVLQKLGLTYGSTVKARDLYKLIFERIPRMLEMCRLGHSKPSVWYCGCGSATAESRNYQKGRRLLIKELG